MKNKIILFGIIISVVSILSGQTINIIKKDGSNESYNLSDIINITFNVDETNNGETVTDIDGNVYQTVKIGDQWWMAENLKVTRYRNGDAISHVIAKTLAMKENETTGITDTGEYYVYGNDPSNSSTYGYLYNWYAVSDLRNIAPSGWHVPTDSEWQVLVDYLGGELSAGGKMKETGTSHWNSPNEGANNESGFSSIPGGYRKGG